jgi:hypothetical protein
MDLDSGGKNEVKVRAARRAIGSPQASVMRFHDGSADAKSDVSAMMFGGKEGVENLVRLLRREPTPVSLTDTTSCSIDLSAVAFNYLFLRRSIPPALMR